jgi:alpha-glucosidase (family GH31 glycosyl hydrolase)
MTCTPTARRISSCSVKVWFDFSTGQAISGGQLIQTSADLERIPLFVREGTILPLANEDGPWCLNVYTGADGEIRVGQCSTALA